MSIGRRLFNMARSELNALLDRAAEAERRVNPGRAFRCRAGGRDREALSRAAGGQGHAHAGGLVGKRAYRAALVTRADGGR
jgi:hypothetical protein